MHESWSKELPIESGWYWVEWDPPDPVPDIVWIEVNGTRGWDDLLWGYDQNDLMPMEESGATAGVPLWVKRTP